MKIEIFTDFACPFCYIAKKRLEQAITELNMDNKIEIEYKAFQLQPNASKDIAVPLLEEGKINEEKFAAIYEHAKEVNLTFHMEKVLIGNTENAHKLAKFARLFNKDDEFIEETMQQYFTEGLNVNDEDALLNIVEKIGLPVHLARQMLHTPEAFQEELALDRYDIQQIPVTSVPFFVFENRYGIKGAEPLEIFKQTLLQTAEYLDKQATIQIQGSTRETCSVDGCD